MYKKNVLKTSVSDGNQILQSWWCKNKALGAMLLHKSLKIFKFLVNILNNQTGKRERTKRKVWSLYCQIKTRLSDMKRIEMEIINYEFLKRMKKFKNGKI